MAVARRGLSHVAAGRNAVPSRAIRSKARALRHKEREALRKGGAPKLMSGHKDPLRDQLMKAGDLRNAQSRSSRLARKAPGRHKAVSAEIRSEPLPIDRSDRAEVSRSISKRSKLLATTEVFDKRR